MFHFCTHAWEISHIDDGTMIVLTQRDLDLESVPTLVDDLIEVVRENGQPNLYLDFSKVRMISSVVIGKMIAVNDQLRELGGRLVMLGLDPVHYQMFEVTRLTELLDIRRAE